MTNEELIEKAQKGNKEAMACLIKENCGLIWSIVKRFSGRGYDREDLFQTGAVGLVKAIERFDISLGLKFSTYAVPMIIGEVKRFLRDDGMIKISRSIKETAAKVRAAQQLYIQNYGEEADSEKLAQILNMEKSDVELAIEASKDVESIYKTVNGEDSDIYVIDKLKADEKYTPNEELMLLREAIKKLDENERKIIVMRYFNDKTQSETARKLGISQVQVSRLEKKILSKIRENIT